METHIDDGLDLVVAYRTLAEHGILDAYGHVSMRSPGRPDRFLLSRSLAPELVTIDDIMEFDLDSEPVDGQGRELYSERYISTANSTAAGLTCTPSCTITRLRSFRSASRPM